MSVAAARGTRDLLPAQMHARLHVVGIIRDVFAKFGFEPLETPAIERIETLMGKYGDEGEKLIFKILERGEGGREGKADLALRYDLTVPLARVIAMNGALPLPFKRYQIQPVWRADRPQKGRYREFSQCDVDTVGAPGRLADAECVAVVDAALAALGFSDFEVKVNHRKLLAAIVRELAKTDRETDVLVAIDKLDKIGWDGVAAELDERGIGSGWLGQLKDMTFDDYATIAPEAVAELREVFAAADALGATRVRFDATLARGLSYYTGPVFETVITGGGIGSVSGGGRYDGLIGMFSGKDIPAVGVSLGLERLLVVMEDRGMLPGAATRTKAYVTIFSAETQAASLRLARDLRAAGVETETWLGAPGALGKQFKQAGTKGVPFALVLGPDEVAAGTVVVKDLRAGTQRAVPAGEVLDALR